MKKQQEIDRLREENARLKGRLRYQERTAKEGFFGSSTPSSKVPVKPSALVEPALRFGGAKPGHVGHGRHTIPPEQAQRVEWIPAPERCPECGRVLQTKGTKARTVIDVQPLRRQTVCYQLDQKYCSHCRKLVRASAPGVLPRGLLSNRLLAHVAVQHYVYGVTLGQLENQLDVGYGTLMGALHQLARLLEPACEGWVQDYRNCDQLIVENITVRTCAAITNDGLRHRPDQIWSQGEDDNNHDWFPTYDFPNDRATSEVIS